MMDAAPEWVAPWWFVWPSDTQVWPTVFVLNPGPTQASVTVRFNYATGTLFQKYVLTIGPRHVEWALPDNNQKASFGGWVHIKSDQPILPWGITPRNAWVSDPVSMTFYRQEVALPPGEKREPKGTRRGRKRKPKKRP